MPYFEIFTPENAYTDEDKERFATAITEASVAFTGIPAFYVLVRFHEMPNKTLYVGGKAHINFVRIVTDTIARQMEAPEIRYLCMEALGPAIVPFVEGRGYDWEIHLDETPRDLWRIQGLIPPPTGSDIEKLWVKENRPIPYEVANT